VRLPNCFAASLLGPWVARDGGCRLTGRVQLQLFQQTDPARDLPGEFILIKGIVRPLRFVRNHRARRYILRVGSNGLVSVTVPRGGTLAQARAVANRHQDWIAGQLEKRQGTAGRDPFCGNGTEVMLRGVPTPIQVVEGDHVRLVRIGPISFAVERAFTDLRPVVERQLLQHARAELPPRVRELACRGGFEVKSVSVRNQRSRWGSCSRRGAISLNWRLVQMPASVSDYVILHELAHLRVMNHSRRYWKLVEQLCPAYREAEGWLKKHGHELRGA